jgi:uncharacterized protein DUF6622
MAEVLQQTPAWVFVLFVCLVYIGYLQSRTRSVVRWQLLIVPAATLCLSLYGTWSAFGANPIGFAAWSGGAGLALIVGRELPRPRSADYPMRGGRLTLPGSWVPMGLIMALFFANYFVSMALATHMLSPRLPAFVGISSFTFGALSATFVARAVRRAGETR